MRIIKVRSRKWKTPITTSFHPWLLNISFLSYNSGGTQLQSENKWTLDEKNIDIKHWFLTRDKFVPTSLLQGIDGNDEEDILVVTAMEKVLLASSEYKSEMLLNIITHRTSPHNIINPKMLIVPRMRNWFKRTNSC